ncbi:hypothetical protein NC653_004895 [Populus alba x Populus x berolinensis]|uniref:Uncharacterized protein n=1 Tax=Populus alba x Populus x berolinensis TaxID=444605 RepID=A0AAD6RAK3_9ROSI|nr:hypothetical protein NC653_004895 [Populus alba x Populus x berolinensis]
MPILTFLSLLLKEISYSHASSFARIMEGGYARRLFASMKINNKRRDLLSKVNVFGVEQYEIANLLMGSAADWKIWDF